MGRSIFTEEHIEKYIEKLLQDNKWYIGVIIGQLTSQKDYVVHLARTPDPVEDEVSEENVEEDIGDASILTKKPKVIRPSSLEELDEKWVSTHAKQVSRMLPGGLGVIGLFAIAPPAMLKSAQNKLKQMLFSVYKSLSKNALLTSQGDITERILLQIDSATRRLTCTTVDVADVKSVPKPAEWKVQTGGQRWVKLTSQVSLNFPMAVPSDSKAHTLLKQIQSGLTDFGKHVSNSIITVDGGLRSAQETLITNVEKKSGKGGKGKGAAAPDTGSITKDVNIYLPFTSNAEHSEPVQSESQSVINMFGSIAVRAFVCGKATVGDAIMAVRSDLLRSLCSRCELLCEEFDIVEDGKQGRQVYDPPIRLFCRLPGTQIDVCDYVFQDEKKEEVQARISELLDVEEVSELEEAEKSAAEDDTWSCQSSLSGMSSQQSLASPSKTAANTVRIYIGAAVGGVAAILAAWFSFVYIDN